MTRQLILWTTVILALGASIVAAMLAYQMVVPGVFISVQIVGTPWIFNPTKADLPYCLVMFVLAAVVLWRLRRNGRSATTLDDSTSTWPPPPTTRPPSP